MNIMKRDNFECECFSLFQPVNSLTYALKAHEKTVSTAIYFGLPNYMNFKNMKFEC